MTSILHCGIKKTNSETARWSTKYKNYPFFLSVLLRALQRADGYAVVPQPDDVIQLVSWRHTETTVVVAKTKVRGKQNSDNWHNAEIVVKRHLYVTFEGPKLSGKRRPGNAGRGHKTTDRKKQTFESMQCGGGGGGERETAHRFIIKT